MYEFQYHRPGSIDAAVALLKKAPEGRPLAGGMSLIPTMKLRLSAPGELVDLNAISGLSGISRDGGTLTIGAMTRHSEVAASQVVAEAIPALSRLAGGIGDPLCRNRGTIGGSISFNDPAADYPAGLLGLGATIHTTERTIAADAFFGELYETALETGELVTKISFPIPEEAGWSKFANLASRFAIVAVMTSLRDGVARVAVTGAAASVFRVAGMEAELAKSYSPDAIEGVAISPEGLNADLHADPEYRAGLIGVLARRAVAGANQ